jgi:lipid-A-disaccharide synthase
MSLTKSQRYFISAGEFSGDLLAAELVHALRNELPDVQGYGISGDTMIQAGVTPLAHIQELSVMGILEVARRIADIRMLEQRILAWIDRNHPSFAVLVDFPGFHFRLAEQLKLRGIPVYQYVAPKVWAWGLGRVRQLRENFSGVFGVLPFEEEFFLRHGVPYQYVGSPHYDRVSKISVTPESLGLPATSKIIAFLPGSRISEINGILPVMLRIRRELLRLDPLALCVIALAPSLNWDDVSSVLGHPTVVRLDHDQWEASGFRWMHGQSLELMACSDAAVVASGTATLECALARTPMVVVYVMNGFSYQIAKRVVSLKWVSLVNLLMNREVVREFIQDIDPKSVAQKLHQLSRDSIERRMMLMDFDTLIAALEPCAAARTAGLIAKDFRERRSS